MENNLSANSEKNIISKAKSYSSGPHKKHKNEAVKRKSFVENEAMRSLDLALGRLKKSKRVNLDSGCSAANYSQGNNSNMFIDTRSSKLLDVDNISSMSMNFSHYELMRNLSSTNCNSDEELSSTTCTRFSSLSDMTGRNERLEKYFRSVEVWGRNYKEKKRDFEP